ncbi:hypothetical protein ARMGADRAFT_1008596 [Armillaria gallica]|uniref:Uncharacterized protein n=1 Tax=Armillaria gallica TaxID=47427 RepID=A0A2H3E4L2_ARMGA|nr:hypothetical protein ARMGADRAFT_1008596 [Armillaria gallica]
MCCNIEAKIVKIAPTEKSKFRLMITAGNKKHKTEEIKIYGGGAMPKWTVEHVSRGSTLVKQLCARLSLGRAKAAFDFQSESRSTIFITVFLILKLIYWVLIFHSNYS